jgi:hypothetical protein
LKLSESEDLCYIGINETIQKKATFLFSPLPLVEVPKDKDKKPKATDLIEFILEQRAGSTSSAPTYKLKVSRFCEGTVSEWISFRKAIAELWKQNGLNDAQDKIANICTILRGDSLTGFEERIQELTTSVNDTGEKITMEITEETIEDGLNAVAHMVFPFRALENQKQWMRRRMKKPKELSIRKYVAAVGRLNNSPLHNEVGPGGAPCGPPYVRRVRISGTLDFLIHSAPDSSLFCDEPPRVRQLGPPFPL